MSNYYIHKVIDGDFDLVIAKVIDALKVEGFGVLTDIDVRRTLNEKLGINFRSYRILGACNPPLAHEALTADSEIEVMLPCNVIVQDLGGGRIEVAAINPLKAMEPVDNLKLTAIAGLVAGRLARVIGAL